MQHCLNVVVLGAAVVLEGQKEEGTSVPKLRPLRPRLPLLPRRPKLHRHGKRKENMPVVIKKRSKKEK
jgi:hypothetical protein